MADILSWLIGLIGVVFIIDGIIKELTMAKRGTKKPGPKAPKKGNQGGGKKKK